MAFNEKYKLWHKPNIADNATTRQGYYKVANREKYVGNPELVVYRSSWEFSFCKWCDFSPSILRWGSEPIRIPYYDRVSKLEENKKLGLDPNNSKNWITKFYNVDFWVEVKKAEGITEKWFIEVKPAHKLKKPQPPKQDAPLKDIKRFNNSVKEYLINEAKFAAMNEWAVRHGAKFYIFTEEQMQKFGILGGKFDYNQQK